MNLEEKAREIFSRFTQTLAKVDLKLAVSIPAVIGATTVIAGCVLGAHDLGLLKHVGDVSAGDMDPALHLTMTAMRAYKHAIEQQPFGEFLVRGIEGKLPSLGVNTQARGLAFMAAAPIVSAASVTLARGFQKIKAALHGQGEQMRREATQAVVAAEPAPVDDEGRYTWAKNRAIASTIENDMRAMTDGVAFAMEHPETPAEVREYLRKPLETAMRADVNGGPERLARHHYQQIFHAVAIAGDFLNSAPDHFGRLPKVVDQKLFAAFNSATSPSDVSWGDVGQAWRHATHTEMREPPGTVAMLRRIALAHRVNVHDLELRGDKVVLNTGHSSSSSEHAAPPPWSERVSPGFRPICEVGSPFWRETERQVYILNRYARQHGLKAVALYVRDDVVYEENPDAFVDRKVCDVNSSGWDAAHRELIREQLGYSAASLEDRKRWDSEEHDAYGTSSNHRTKMRMA